MIYSNLFLNNLIWREGFSENESWSSLFVNYNSLVFTKELEFLQMSGSYDFSLNTRHCIHKMADCF